MTANEFDNQEIAKGDVIHYHDEHGIRRSSFITGVDWEQRQYYVGDNKIDCQCVVKYISNCINPK